MRDDKLGSPVISTYAIGGDTTSPRRGGGLALPIIVILGTASVAAIVSVSFEGATPIVADLPGPTRDPAAPTGIARPSAPAGQANPASVARVDLDSAQGPAPGKASAPDLPMLSVLQPRADERPARPTASVRGLAPARPAARVRPAAAPASEGSRALATECTEGCEEPSEFARNSAPAAEVAQPGATLDEVFVPLAADEYRDAADLGDQTQPLVADAAVAQVDSPVAPVLLADSRPVQAAEPTGELIADARGPATAPTAAAEASPVAAGGPPVESEYTGAAEAASFQQSRSPAEPAATSAGSSIPEHLARIGERYAAVPIAEPGATDRGLVERESAPADQSALVERSVALDLAGSAGSNVIVQDDELVAIRLGELVSLLEDRLDHPLYVWMSSASVASKFVTAQTLAAAGIHSRYDPERKQLVISTTGE